MRIIIATTVLLLTLPIVGLKCLVAWYQQKKISFYIQEFAGKNLERIQHRTVTIANAPLADIDSWFLYLKGHYDLIGPNPITHEAALKLQADKRVRFQVAPGIISHFKIRKASGIAHQDEYEIDAEFANNDTQLRRAQIFLIWSLQHCLGSASRKFQQPKDFTLFDVHIQNVTMKGAVQRIINSLDSKSTNTRPKKFAFVNADCVNKYYANPAYKNALHKFDNIFADGIGVKIAARWQGISVAENVNGTDMFPLLCKELNENGKSIYLLGASKAVINAVITRLKMDFPSLKIAGYCDGYLYKDNPQELHMRINSSGAQLLVVAMGAPLQEHWIISNESQLKVKAVIGVGGLFDFYSQQVPRAPIWLRELSLEWVWRLFAQPLDKGKRYLIGNPLFLLRAALEAKAYRKNTNISRSKTAEKYHDLF